MARLGFADARHTAVDGFQASDLLVLNESSFALGTSDLFVGIADVDPMFGRRAQTAWVADLHGVTRRVGLYDDTHTRDDGRQEIYPVAVNDSGVSVGASARFAGHDYRGQSAWVAAESGNSILIGFFDAAHTASDGSTISAPIALNRANKLIGYSLNPGNGHRTGWIANAIGQFNPIGLFDAAHTSADGRHASFPVALNDAGYIAGNSDFFVVDEVFPGSTAWLRRPDRSMRLIGFQSGVHEAPDGQHVSRVELLSGSGYMAGWSARYESASNQRTGQTAWVTHVDGPNRPIGLYDGIHRGMNGVVHSTVVHVNESGHAIGTSYQYEGASPDEFDQAGLTAWIATPAGATVRVGFYDAEHSVNGHQFNEVNAQNDGNSAIGGAARYQPNGDYHGRDAFVANAAGYTTPIGLTDAMHTRADGYHASFAGALTSGVGYVAGYTERYNGGTEQVGQTAWVYTRTSRTYVRIELSVRASDGYAESVITGLEDDGSAVGRFRLFASDGTDLGERAFAYRPGQGAFVLHENLDVDPANDGWDHFADASFETANGAIAGAGVRTSGATHGLGVYLVNEDPPMNAPRALLTVKIQLP